MLSKVAEERLGRRLGYSIGWEPFKFFSLQGPGERTREKVALAKGVCWSRKRFIGTFGKGGGLLAGGGGEGKDASCGGRGGCNGTVGGTETGCG